MVTIEDAREVSNVIIDSIDPISILVFGSVSKKGFGEDLDLLIIVDDIAEKTSDIHLKTYKCLKNYY